MNNYILPHMGSEMLWRDCMKKKLFFLLAIVFAITAITAFSGGAGLSALKTVQAATPTFQKVSFVTGVVTATTLNVRQGPGVNYPVVCQIKKGDTVKIFGKLGDWYALYEAKSGCVGAASSKYIKVYTTGTTATATPKPAPVGTPKPTATIKPSPAVTSSPLPGGGGGTSEVSKDEQDMLNLVNKARADAGAGPLAFDPELQKVARLKAKDMIDNNYFSHQSPTYGSPFDMMKKFGISFSSAGENIAGNSTVNGAFNAWMGSEGHKKNILNPKFNLTGIGIVSSPTYGKMFVEMFIGR